MQLRHADGSSSAAPISTNVEPGSLCYRLRILAIVPKQFCVLFFYLVDAATLRGNSSAAQFDVRV